jgi:23S rRNA (cytosine1962-C5)-methyltransferase
MNDVVTSPTAAEALPVIRIQPGHHKRARGGHPWVYSNEIEMTRETKALEPGRIVTLSDANGGPVGTAMFNPRPLISVRLLTTDANTQIDAGWLTNRFARALMLRDRLLDQPFYRLIHAEADGLPGLIVDRYGDVCVAQLNTAGMDRLAGPIVEALQSALKPTGIVLQRDGNARRLEGLDDAPAEIIGEIPSPAPITENGVRFLADLSGGQKTGWFYDHRENRARVAALSKGRRVADVYSYLGGFGLQAAAAEAAGVLCVDRSQPALDLAARAAADANLDAICRFEKAEAFSALEALANDSETFDVVVSDPPAFVKSKKDLKPGARGYRKLARLSASIVAPDGALCIASCSHHMDVSLFAEQVRRGVADAGRSGRILHTSGAGPDHPVHPFLPESAYLKCLFLHLD